MKDTFLLIDYENIQKVDLSGLKGDLKIKIFVGFSQKNLPFELVQQAQGLGDKLEWVKIDGNGNNALDFHVAFYIGKLFQEQSKSSFIILSKDKGFDPLVKHINRLNGNCRRINSLLEISGKTQNHPSEKNLARVIELLSKVEKNKRPRKRSTLKQHISSLFQKKLGDQEVEEILDRLFIKNMVSEINNNLIYDF